MPTGVSLGLVPEGILPNPIEVGKEYELIGLPEFGRAEKNGSKFDTVTIPTSNGKISTTSAVILGQLRSSNPNGIGAVLAKALDLQSTLTVYSVERDAINPESGEPTGRKNLALSLYKPRS